MVYVKKGEAFVMMKKIKIKNQKSKPKVCAWCDEGV